MQPNELHRLAALVKQQRDTLLADWRQRVRQLPGAAHLDAPTINDQVPELLDSLADALIVGPLKEAPETESISAEHGLLRWQAGFDVTEVVGEYNILRQCLQDAAERDGMTLKGKPLHIINQVFDQAIANAIKAFETMMTIQLQQRHEEHIAFILHDLRSPLEALSLATTLLERSLGSSARNHEIESALSVLRGNINRMSERVRRILSAETGLGKSFHPAFTLLNLQEQVDKIVHDLEPLAISSQTQVKNQIGAHLEVYSDETLLSQILQNLISNALKFTTQGIVEIGARALADEGTIECWVKDSGVGIPAEELGKVFDRFETSAESEKTGLGLGLAIVKEIVELHHGTITVQSEVGKGSTFTFVLPQNQPS